MDLRTKLERGVLSVDLRELVEAMDAPTKEEIAKLLAADDELIKVVVELAADPSRYGHYFSNDEDGAWWFDPRTVLEIREKLVPAMPEIARQAMAEVIRQRDQAKQDLSRMEQWAWKLFHAWPADCWHRRPDLPKWAALPAEHEAAVKTEVDAALPAESSR